MFYLLNLLTVNTLIIIISFIIILFANRFMEGNKYRKRTLVQLILLGLSLILTINSDHILILFTSWIFSNILLVNLIAHKWKWQAASASAILASKAFLFSTTLLGISLFLIYLETNTTSIQTINSLSYSPVFLFFILILLIMSAMAQSAIWPFHKWLLSSLNSPTPTSAMINSLAINLGVFLLIRFAPLIIHQTLYLNIILFVGIITVILGTFWKFIQNDIKRRLACSTMAQMGIIFVLCGLKLFSTALIVVCIHMIYKSYLFLTSGNIIQAKKLSKKSFNQGDKLNEMYVYALNASQPDPSTITTYHNDYTY